MTSKRLVCEVEAAAVVRRCSTAARLTKGATVLRTGGVGLAYAVLVVCAVGCEGGRASPTGTFASDGLRPSSSWSGPHACPEGRWVVERTVCESDYVLTELAPQVRQRLYAEISVEGSGCRLDLEFELSESALGADDGCDSRRTARLDKTAGLPAPTWSAAIGPTSGPAHCERLPTSMAIEVPLALERGEERVRLSSPMGDCAARGIPTWTTWELVQL